MKPATALPWGMARDYEIRSFHTPENGHSSEYIATMFQEHYRIERMEELAQNAAYIVHACNAYPRLVEALCETLAALQCLPSTAFELMGDDVYEFIAAKHALLRELGE